MKACPYCAEQIQDAAIVCKHCGRDLATGHSERTVVVTNAASWSPGVAALLSLIIPGAGQMYKGQVIGGLLWLFFVVIGYVALVVPGIVLHLCCILAAAAGRPPAARTVIASIPAASSPALPERTPAPPRDTVGVTFGRLFAAGIHPIRAWKQGYQSELLLIGLVLILVGAAIASTYQ